MISKNYVKKFCKDDISKIENYEKAINDDTRIWECHHRLELTLDGEYAHNVEELIRLGMYYNRPYFELIFLPHNEHRALHKRSEASKSKMSKIMMGKKNGLGKPKSIFGELFKECYGITQSQDPKLYEKERSYYRRNGHLKGNLINKVKEVV